jgi:hypothetical protein
MEGVMIPLLEGQHKIPTQNKADLLGMYVACFFVPADIFEDKKEVLLVVFNFWALFRIYQIFENQGMELKAGGNVLERCNVMYALNAEPGLCGIGKWAREFNIRCENFLFNRC